MSVKSGWIIVLILLFSIPSWAQVKSIWDSRGAGYYYKVDSADYETNDGPNTKFYQHGFLSYGQGIPMEEADSLQTEFGSAFFEYGTRMKWKVNKWFAVGSELSYQFLSYNIKQDSLKNLLGMGQVNDSQRLKRHLLNGGAYIRFNFGQRGNHLGKYIDLGGFGSWAIGSRLTVKRTDDPATQNFSSKDQTYTFRKLRFTSPFEYGVNVRFGFNKVIFWGRYRMSDLFRANDDINNGRLLPSLTPLTAGIQLAF